MLFLVWIAFLSCIIFAHSLNFFNCLIYASAEEATASRSAAGSGMTFTATGSAEFCIWYMIWERILWRPKKKTLCPICPWWRRNTPRLSFWSGRRAFAIDNYYMFVLKHLPINSLLPKIEPKAFVSGFIWTECIYPWPLYCFFEKDVGKIMIL